MGLSVGLETGEGVPGFGFPGVGEGLGIPIGLTIGVGFPGFVFPGVGQDWIVLVFVMVLYLNSVVVFVLKTVTYEIGEIVELGEELRSLKAQVTIKE